MKLSLKIFAGLTAVALAQFSAGAETFTNRPLPGIICIFETRTNPPERLFVAEVDLKNQQLHLRVAAGVPTRPAPANGRRR